MSKNNHQPQRPTPQQTVADAERTIAALEQKQAALNQQREAADAERSRIAFAAHAQSDPEASRQLAALTEQALRRDREAGDIIAALATARHRLQQARLAEAKAADVAQARELRAAVRQFVEAGSRVDHALGLLARDGHALTDALNKVHALGAQFPTQQQLDSLGHICLRSSIMQTPWARSVETVAPGQRRSFRSLVEAWASNIEQNNIRPRLSEQANTTEAA
jgi:hypothetical protein